MQHRSRVDPDSCVIELRRFDEPQVDAISLCKASAQTVLKAADARELGAEVNCLTGVDGPKASLFDVPPLGILP